MIEIHLGRGKMTAFVDDQDADWARLGWHVMKSGQTFYAVHTVHDATGRHELRLHRAILKPPKDVEVDHINGNGLDCRRQNLRLATRTQNGKNRRLNANNTSGFKGVHHGWRCGREFWRAAIWTGGRRNGRTIHIGHFTTAEAAARAYDRAAIRLHGRFARLNFPDGF